MGKNKGGKRLGKKQVSELLQNLFQHNPNETFSFKQIFRALKLDTHPLKMLAIDVMEEMAWDDFLSKVSDNSYRLNLKTQVQEGTFRRKANGRNSFLPDDGGTPVFVAERNSMSAMDGDRVKVSYMARRDKHIKEAMVIEIVRRAHDQIVGKLRVDKDWAFLIPMLLRPCVRMTLYFQEDSDIFRQPHCRRQYFSAQTVLRIRTGAKSSSTVSMRDLRSLLRRMSFRKATAS